MGSALLNVVIVLTSFPVLVLAGGPGAVVPTLVIMAGDHVLGLDRHLHPVLVRLARSDLLDDVLPRAQRKVPNPLKEVGVADRWLDVPG